MKLLHNNKYNKDGINNFFTHNYVKQRVKNLVQVFGKHFAGCVGLNKLSV